MIDQVLKPGRITSVITASANNEMAYKESHEGFEEYQHITNMTRDELCMAFGNDIHGGNVRDVLDYSGGVPYYALLYATQPGAEMFQGEVNESVFHSLKGLRPRSEWEFVKKSIFSCLLDTTSSEREYDKKFLIRVNSTGMSWRYQPLFPAVLTAYRTCLWEDLMKFVIEQERELLNVCSSKETTNHTRGHLLETMVIRRCQVNDFTIRLHDDHLVNIDHRIECFGGRLLPVLTAASVNGIYVPFDHNFPAIDLVCKQGRIIIGIQVHVSSHDDVASPCFGLCQKAGWFEEFDTVYLLYLSPEGAVRNLVTASPTRFEGIAKRSASGERRVIFQRAISKDSVSCLKDLQWPNGCSLAPV
jgi:hypothetical protein